MNDNFKKGFSKHILPNITKYKSYLNLISKYLKTFKDNFNEIKKTDLISDENKIFYHELEHDIIDLYDTTENLKEKLNEQFNMYHTITSSKLNDIMKTLTIVSVLFNPLTFIAGVYGTNFKYFPEIYWKYGYFLMWGMIIICGLCMLLYFKKKKWF
jgi:magnesium transporter